MQGAWVSFWVWWGFKQASIYLGLGVALIDQTRSGPGPALLQQAFQVSSL